MELLSTRSSNTWAYQYFCELLPQGAGACGRKEALPSNFLPSSFVTFL